MRYQHSREGMKRGAAEIIEETSVQAIDAPAVIRQASTVTPVPLDCVPTDFPLPCPLYVPVGDQFVKFRSRNDTITAKRLHDLSTAGLDAIYIAKSHWPKFTEGLEAFRMPSELEANDRMRHMRALLMTYEEGALDASSLPRRPIFEKLELLVGQLAEEIYKNPAQGLRHLRHNHDPRLYYANHAVNGAIYGTLIAVSLKYPLIDVRRIAYACLVHDVGNYFIPRELLLKKGALTPEEFQVMRTHCVKGAELLQSLGAAPEVVQTAYQHHERNDGKGYPQGLPGKQIHPYAKICAIADVYDAITSNRPHQEGLSAQEAMHRMRSQEGLFDMDFLAKLSFDKWK